MASRTRRLQGVRFLERLGGATELRSFVGLTRGGFAASVLSPDAERAIARLDQLGVLAIERADAAIRIEASAAAKRIAAKWPVDTGFSRARWRAVQRGVANWAIVNDANYAEYVHRKGQTTPLVQTLVPAEIRVAVTRIGKRLRALLRQREVLFRPAGRVTPGLRL